MKNRESETGILNESTITTLSTTWFQRIENLHQSVPKNSGLECATRCSARCCPKLKSPKNTANAVGHVAIMLPFELEYILSITNISPMQLQRARIEFVSDVYIDIGFTNSTIPCPFLTENNNCGIYDIRPLDC